MQVIIMAGGEGSRLRPLTCGRPKPLVPILNKPVMEHAINLLKKHGLTDIGVTLQYLPEEIKDYFGDGSEFGVKLRYFIEEVPLGTAGSVKNAEEFLKETFLVLSGDALTDFNLTEALSFHRQKGAAATLVLTKVDYPLEYGVVITGEDGKIIRFLEKPSWGEVFSDTVNTGIYVLEPEVLEYFPKETKYDFSQDLFPLLLKQGKPLYGCTLSGYWCDIGNLQQYQQAHFDILAGKVDVEISGRQIKKGIWVEAGVDIDPTVTMEGPAFIGENSLIGPEVNIGAYSVLGSNTILGQGSSLKRSILWNGANIGKRVELRGAVFCNHVTMESNSSAYEGAVLGDNASVRARSVIKPGVKIWPGKVIEKQTILQNSLIWGNGTSKSIFGLDGVSGRVNVDLTPEWAARLGAAFGSTIKEKGPVVISCTHDGSAHMIKDSFCAGLISAGLKVLDLGSVITPIARYAVKALEAKGGVHIKSSLEGEEMRINFFNHQGAGLTRNDERKIENLFVREDFQRAAPGNIAAVSQVPAITRAYLENLTKLVDLDAIREKRIKLVLAFDKNYLGGFIPPLLADLNCDLIAVESTKLEQLAGLVTREGADMGVMLDNHGEKIRLIDNQGQVISEDQFLALVALMVFKGSQGGTVAVPVTASRVIERLANDWQGQVIRTKTSPQDLMANLLKEEVLANQGSISQFLLSFDGIAALVRTLEFLAQEELNLAQLMESLPCFYISGQTIDCPWEAKGRIMRELIEEKKDGPVELLDGIKIYHDDGWALVLPDAEEPLYRVYSEGYSQEVAQSLTDFYIDKINTMKKG